MEIPFEVGKKYFIRTVTYHLIGEVDKIIGNFVQFKSETMAWVADSGRFTQAINDGNLDEVEPVDVVGGVSLGAITDYFEWKHDLPRKQS